MSTNKYLETLAVLLLEDSDGISSDGTPDTIEVGTLAKTIQEMRRHDPFLYFSIPGALKYDSLKTESSAKELASNIIAKNNKITRKTRVSCEVYSELYWTETLDSENAANDTIWVEEGGGDEISNAQEENEPRRNFETPKSQEQRNKKDFANKK